MSPRFAPGDKAVIDGMNVEIRSWPQNDEGPFAWVQILPGGQEVQGIKWVSHTKVDAGQLGILPGSDVSPGQTDGPQPVVAITQGVVIDDTGVASVPSPEESE